MKVQVDIVYTADCTSWEKTAHLVNQVMTDLGLEGEFIYWLCESEEQAWEWDFVGSPTVLIDGKDPFRSPDDEPGLKLRTYFSAEKGLVPYPTYEMPHSYLTKYVVDADWSDF
ncbi:MAG: hypothetical protein GX484_13060 [Chloroflexi bacterium]|nr:hypothetical protein [Chloroflexota bacterium]